MIQTLKKLSIPVLLLLGVGFVLFLINQVSGIYFLVSDWDPILGKITLVIIGILLSSLLVTPFAVYFRMPKPLKRPTTASEVSEYKDKLVRRMADNKILRENKAVPQNARELESSIRVLNRETEKLIFETSSIVFLTTSVSQNGKLDSLTVLGTQMRMVWKIAHIYYQRPTLRDLLFLYTQVGVNSFIAGQIEDLDISRQIEPVASAIFKNASGKAVPFIGPASQIILDSLLEGSTNAFLTLRVGIMAKKYCGELGVIDKEKLKKEVLKEATVQLKAVTLKSSGQIISSVLKATSNAGMDTLRSGWEGILQAGTKVKEEISTTTKRINPFRKRKSGFPAEK